MYLSRRYLWIRWEGSHCQDRTRSAACSQNNGWMDGSVTLYRNWSSCSKRPTVVELRSLTRHSMHMCQDADERFLRIFLCLRTTKNQPVGTSVCYPRSAQNGFTPSGTKPENLRDPYQERLLKPWKCFPLLLFRRLPQAPLPMGIRNDTKRGQNGIVYALTEVPIFVAKWK